MLAQKPHLGNSVEATAIKKIDCSWRRKQGFIKSSQNLIGQLKKCNWTIEKIKLGSGPKFLKISQNFSKFLKISQNFSKFLKISQNISKYLKISQNISKYLALHKYVLGLGLKKFQKISKILKKSQNISKSLKKYIST